ncbi:MAG: glycoside hydrolase family 19 protein [Sphingomonas sp.]|uniref:glycoside hydrolase family 19 protein n=1 Tax=Sphingomonas sp. TaxID=28214 RepID=UPI001AD14FF1|nr:glycoside hydrolase family 19 protein [Sphingomonas sp.]MBN8807080.1 glycoside hydrolase family 19 protein [Sphingomonas sp.]
MTVTAAAIVARFAPRALPAYAAAFRDPGGLLATAGIATPLRLAHFMAQAMEETGALTVAVENGNYSAGALARMWDSGNWHRYFADRDACIAMAATCRRDGGETLFNLVYGNRMGNGPPASGDGWRFRGRGVLQTTGRGNYATCAARWGIDFVARPELVAAAEHALKPAIAEWTDKNANAAADRDDIERVTLLVNGGRIGLVARRAWLARIKPFVGIAS